MELNIPTKYRQDIENATNLLKKEGCFDKIDIK